MCFIVGAMTTAGSGGIGTRRKTDGKEEQRIQEKESSGLNGSPQINSSTSAEESASSTACTMQSFGRRQLAVNEDV